MSNQEELLSINGIGTALAEALEGFSLERLTITPVDALIKALQSRNQQIPGNIRTWAAQAKRFIKTRALQTAGLTPNEIHALATGGIDSLQAFAKRDPTHLEDILTQSGVISSEDHLTAAQKKAQGILANSLVAATNGKGLEVFDKATSTTRVAVYDDGTVLYPTGNEQSDRVEVKATREETKSPVWVLSSGVTKGDVVGTPGGTTPGGTTPGGGTPGGTTPGGTTPGGGTPGGTTPGGGTPSANRPPEPIKFIDICQRNEAARQRLKDERFTLRQRKHDLQGPLPPIYEARLLEIDNLLYRDTKSSPITDDSTLPDNPPDLPNKVFDSLYIKLQELFGQTNQTIGDHIYGKLPSQQRTPSQDLTPDETAFAAVYGIMVRENATDPNLGQRFYDAFSLARSEYNGNQQLFDRVLEFLLDEGDLPYQPVDQDPCAPTGDGRFVFAEQWASVVRTLISQSVNPQDIHLGLKARQALANYVAADESAPPSSLAIDLPDLEQQASVEISKDNLDAMQAIYFASMLEELKLFQVVEKLVELFQIGMLPVGKGNAGDILFKHMKKSVTRFSEFERRNLYARTMGMAGGESSGNPNRDFQMLWLRFISAVSSFARQNQVDSLLRASIPSRVSQEQVRKAGRDLAANLSLYGYGMAYFAATELQSQINEAIALLSDPEIKGAYGAKDMWGVIDQVAAFELGGPRDSIRYRTMATSGAVIIRWLANKAQALASVNLADILDVNEISRPSPRLSGSKATIAPFDSDLINACDRWLAVTGTPEVQIENYADAYEGPTTTSRPIQIPAAARDLLQSVGIPSNGSLPVGMGR